MSIAEQIKALRQQHGLSQSELGAIVGVTDKAVSTWETGLKEPRRATLEKLAAHFHVPVGQITGDSLDDDAIKFALFGDTEVDDVVYEEVKRFAKFANEQFKNRP